MMSVLGMRIDNVVVVVVSVCLSVLHHIVKSAKGLFAFRHNAYKRFLYIRSNQLVFQLAFAQDVKLTSPVCFLSKGISMNFMRSA